MILIAGLAMVVIGADKLVEGASNVARKAGLSEFVIGLTIVGMGTSAPEFVVSVVGAISGNSDVSIGNVIGSNIFNTLLILGITAIFLPMVITRSNKRIDLPINIATCVLLILFGFSATLFNIASDGISRIEGGIFLLLFVIYMTWCFKNGKTDSPTAVEDVPTEKTYISIFHILIGLVGLGFGGRLFVDSATDIAHMTGIPDKVIAITILAGGTSLPELATCIAAAVKKKGDLALGNIIGSNIFNILLILGSAALIHPISFSSINFIDLGVLLISALLVLFSAFTGKNDKLGKGDGIFLLLIFVAYYAYLLISL